MPDQDTSDALPVPRPGEGGGARRADAGRGAISGGPTPTRRALFRAGAAAGVAAALPAVAQQAPALFLDEREMALSRAITARLIPADEHGPSAADLDVPVFISRQLAGPFGRGACTYMAGPFAEGTPEQGYQAEWTPADLYRRGLARFDAAVAAEGARFDRLAPDRQDGVLKRREAGELDLSPVPAAPFFLQVLNNTTEGFFADPVYGGNKGMAAWRMIGFPGAHGAYLEEVERHGVPYTRPPASLVEFEGHGHDHGAGGRARGRG